MRQACWKRTGALALLAGLAVSWIVSSSWGFPQSAAVQSSGVASLRIVVLEGEDGVNIIKKKTAVKPVVEVRDKNNLPVADAAVTFLAPNSGPGVTFAHGSRLLTILTNASGRAAIPSMKPVGMGAFKIAVRASFQGQLASSTIAQTNYLTIAAAHAAGAAAGAVGSTGAAGGAAGTAGVTAAGSAGAAGATVGISGAAIAGIAAGVAAAVGVGVAVSKGGGGSKTAPPPSGTIGPGSGPVIVAPHVRLGRIGKVRGVWVHKFVH